VLAALVPVFWIATVVFAYAAVFGDGIDGRYDDASAVSFCVGFACAALAAGAWTVRDYLADQEREKKD
jgi:hypothetical protein